MADFYADSSVLVKRHVREGGTDWFSAIADPATGNTILTVQVSVVEVISAFQRRVREGTLSAADAARLSADFQARCQVEYRLVALTAPVKDSRLPIPAPFHSNPSDKTSSPAARPHRKLDYAPTSGRLTAPTVQSCAVL